MSAQTTQSMLQSIEAAMGTLDLTLDSELNLFRNRQGAPDPTGASPKMGEDHPSQPVASSPPAMEDSTTQVQETDHAKEGSESEFLESDVTFSSDLNVEAARLLDMSFADLDLEDEDLEFPAQNLTPPSFSPPSLSTSQSPKHEHGDDEEDIPAGAIVPSKALLPSEEDLASSAKLTTYTDPALDDYLESSEALLKHLDTPLSKPQVDDTNSLKWFGWAAGATLVLSLLAVFLLQNTFKTSPSRKPETPAPEAPPQVTAPSPRSETSAPTIEGPNLGAKEFQEVTPGNLAGLPSPSTNSIPNPPPSNTSATTTPPSSSLPSNSGTPADPAGRQFYVVTPYTDEASLATLQQKVPGAKVVNFTAGTRIQLQQFSDETSARTAAATFQQQGIPTEILASAGQ